MYMGLNLHETKKYVSKNDPDKENPTVFHLGVLDRMVSDYIEDNSVEYRVSSPDPDAEALPHILFAARALLIVKFGVRKIENFINPETKEPAAIEAEAVLINGRPYKALPDKILAMLPTSALITELALEITKMNSLSEDEAKN